MRRSGSIRRLVEVLGALPPVHTHVSGILVVPFVGMLTTLPALIPSEEEIDELVRRERRPARSGRAIGDLPS